MKRMNFWLLLVLMATALSVTSCSKDSDDEPGSVIEKTYADDDYLMTERNIKEKLVGTWEISKLKTYSKTTGWTTQTAADLGKWATVKLKNDGTGELMGRQGMHWRVGKDTLVVSSMYLVASIESEGTSMTFSYPLYEYAKDGYTKEMMEEELRRMYPTAVISTELQEYKRLKVNRMSKDFFDLREADNSMGDFWELTRVSL